MTLSNSKQITLGTGLYLKLSWSGTNDVANNYTKVTAKLYLIATNGYTIAGASNAGSITIDGSAYNFSATSQISQNQTKTLASYTKNVAHNADGTKTFTVSSNYNVNITYNGSYLGNKSISMTDTLDTIPRASTPTLSDGNFDIGTKITIYTNRASSSFTHTAKYSFGSASGTIATGIGTSTTWTAPTSLANQMTSSTSKTGTITLYTYNGSTLIGTKSVNFTLTVPNNATYQPTVTNFMATEATAGLVAKFGSLIQGQSKLKISYTATGAYGSTITKNSITANGQTFGSASATTSALTSSGTQIVTGKTTDSRGRTDTQTLSVSVTPYKAPTITSFTAQRANSDGTLNDQGTYVKFTYTALIDGVGGKNDKSFKLKYKLTNDTTWTDIDITPASDYTINGSSVQPGFSVDNNYNVQLVVTDYFMSVTSVLSVPTAFVLMDFHSSGTGMSLGRVAQNANHFDIYMPTHIYAPTDTEDAGLLRLIRSDGSVLGFLTTGPNGTGLKLHMYDRTSLKSVMYINEDGTVALQGDVPWTPLALTNGFTKDGTVTAKYRMKMGVLSIYLKVLAPALTADSTTVVATLPFKPDQEYATQTHVSNTSTIVRVWLRTSGELVVNPDTAVAFGAEIWGVMLNIPFT